MRPFSSYYTLKLRQISKEKLRSSRLRHVLKTISWRFVGSMDTLLLALLVTGDLSIGGMIALAEVASKMILYYLHERVWYKIPYGIKNSEVSKNRHLAKAVTWRVVGTIDTAILAWLISGNAMQGLQIGALETVTKLALYYFHERLWLRINVKFSDGQ